MKRSVVFGVLSKSPRFGRGIVNLCCIESVRVNNSVLAAQNLLQIPNRQKSPFTFVEQFKYYCSSDLAQRNDESDSDVEYGKDPDIDSESDFFFGNRKFIYPHSQNPVILKLHECASVQAVFDIVSEHENEFDVHHACEALVVLWDFYKMYYKINKVTQFEPNSLEISGEELVNKYAGKVISHPNFRKIVSSIEVAMNELSPVGLTCCFLYLKKMGIPCHSSVMQKLLVHIEELLEDKGSDFSLVALSRFIAAIKTNSLKFVASAQKVLPFLHEKIDSCESESDIELLSMCLQNINWFVSPTAYSAFKHKVEKLIESGIFHTYKPSVIVNIALLFNNKNVLRNNETCYVRQKLLSLLKGRIPELEVLDVIRVHKIIESLREPADLHAELSEYASRLLAVEGLTTVDSQSSELLACVTSFCFLQETKNFENILENYLKKKLNPQIITSLFKILRNLKSSNVELCDNFWSGMLQVMKAYPEEHSHANIAKYSMRYMYFNNNLGGTYRHHEYENQLIEWYFSLYKTSIIGFIPSKFAIMIAFLVAYGEKHEKDFLEKLDIMIARLGEMSSQLSELDCVNISRGIQISAHLNVKNNERSRMYHIYVKLNSILNECIRRHIDNNDECLSVTNLLMRSYVMRKAPQTTEISDRLVNRYKNISGPINSRILQEVARNLLLAKCLIPNTIDYLTEYVVQNKAHVFGETVELILYLCYQLGYTPANVDSFLKSSSEVVLRESKRTSGLSVLQASLSLCFFRSLPEEFVHLIFTLPFLERLDEEIANCYAKAVYPSRVRNYLMQLNRAVCLDYPEFDVPWFHKKYCEEVAATEDISTSLFNNEVKEELVNVLGDNKFIREHCYSPYGYRLDFEIFFNEHKIPVTWKQRSDKNIFRKAILLHTEESFSHNVNSLNGYAQMKKRHLEMLGYEVIEIVQTLWNSMYMAEPGMKYDFIKEKVYKGEREAVYRHN